jgi:hypothetical protein
MSKLGSIIDALCDMGKTPGEQTRALDFKQGTSGTFRLAQSVCASPVQAHCGQFLVEMQSSVTKQSFGFFLTRV